MKIKLSNIKTEWLSTKALVLISIFANEAEKLEGLTINIRNEDVLQHISMIANASEHVSLKQLYSNIKREVKMSLYSAQKNQQFAHEVAQVSAKKTQRQSETSTNPK